MGNYFIDNGLLGIRVGLVLLAILVNIVLGIFYFRNAVKSGDLEMAWAILICLFSFILAFIPVDYFLWNDLGIIWLVLMFAFISKVYFGEIIMKGSTLQRVTLFLGLLLILLVVLFAPYIKLPAFFDYFSGV